MSYPDSSRFKTYVKTDMIHCITFLLPIRSGSKATNQYHSNHQFSRIFLLSFEFAKDFSAPDRHNNPEVIINDADKIPTPTAISIRAWCSKITGILS